MKRTIIIFLICFKLFHVANGQLRDSVTSSPMAVSSNEGKSETVGKEESGSLSRSPPREDSFDEEYRTLAEYEAYAAAASSASKEKQSSSASAAASSASSEGKAGSSAVAAASSASSEGKEGSSSAAAASSASSEGNTGNSKGNKGSSEGNRGSSSMSSALSAASSGSDGGQGLSTASASAISMATSSGNNDKSDKPYTILISQAAPDSSSQKSLQDNFSSKDSTGEGKEGAFSSVKAEDISGMTKGNKKFLSSKEIEEILGLTKGKKDVLSSMETKDIYGLMKGSKDDLSSMKTEDIYGRTKGKEGGISFIKSDDISTLQKDTAVSSALSGIDISPLLRDMTGTFSSSAIGCGGCNLANGKKYLGIDKVSALATSLATSVASTLIENKGDFSPVLSDAAKSFLSQCSPEKFCCALNGYYKEFLCYYSCKNVLFAFFKGYKPDGHPCKLIKPGDGVCKYGMCFPTFQKFKENMREKIVKEFLSSVL